MRRKRESHIFAPFRAEKSEWRRGVGLLPSFYLIVGFSSSAIAAQPKSVAGPRAPLTTQMRSLILSSPYKMATFGDAPMAIRKSLIFTIAFTALCVGVSAALNLLGGPSTDGFAQPDAIVWVHLGAAFLGALCLARFLVGSPAAMAAPAPQSLMAVGVVPQLGAYRYRVSGKSAFFSAKRSAQIVTVLFCLMAQFASVESPNTLIDPATNSIIHAKPHNGPLHRKILTT